MRTLCWRASSRYIFLSVCPTQMNGMMKWCFEMMAGPNWSFPWCYCQATSGWGVWGEIGTAATSGA